MLAMGKPPGGGLYDVQFDDGFAAREPFIAETRQIDAAIGAIGDHFRIGTARRRRLLQTVAAKSPGEVQVPNLAMRPQDRVLVDRVVVVSAGPGAVDLDAFEGRDTFGKCRPDCFLEKLVIDIEVEGVRIVVLRRSDAADEACTLGAEVNAGRVDGKRRL